MQLSKRTKQHIVDELRSRGTNWSGRLEEADFLNRFLTLSELPSYDPRFKDLESDLWQHRVNNPNDWEDSWIFDDSRVNLLGDDTRFINFICELLHPAVRDAEEAHLLKEMINFYLKKDGYQLIEDEEYYEPGSSTYKLTEINPTQIEKTFKTTDEFVHEAYEKIDKRLREEDYRGAVTSARTLLEYSIKDIYYQITSDTIERIDDLQIGFKKIQKLLKLDYDTQTNQSTLILLRSFTSIVNALSPIFNNLADRHATKSTVQRNSAQFCTDATKIFVNFLYGRMHNIHGLYPSVYEKIIENLNSDLRTKDRDTLLKSDNIKELLKFCDEYLSKLLIEKLISEYSINSFRDSDIFFAFLRIFAPSIKERNLIAVLEKHKVNDQAVGLDIFLDYLYQVEKSLFTKKVRVLITECKYVHLDLKEK